MSVDALTPAVPPGTVVCAIGDIHGRLDLLRQIVAYLRTLAARVSQGGESLVIVFLGDYIDRGEDSNGVIAQLIALRDEGLGEVVFLRGNHEQAMLDALDQSGEWSQWLQFGGLATLASYGLEPKVARQHAEGDALAREILTRVPENHIAFLRATELYAQYGDYIFVHAGLRPDRLLDEQSSADMLWFRYYADETPAHGKFVVHGHSPNARPVEGRWRAAIDTEAYASGALTLLQLDGATRRFLRATASPGGAAVVEPWEKVDRSYSRGSTSRPSRPAVQAPSPRRRSMNRPGGWRWGVLLSIAAGLMLAALVAWLVYALGRGLPQQAGPAAPGVVSNSVVKPQPATSELASRRPDTPPPQGPPPFQVQIGALDSPELAQRAADAFTVRHPDLMRSRAVEVRSVTRADGRTLYRALVNGFSNKGEAEDFCARVTGAGGRCIVRKSTPRGVPSGHDASRLLPATAASYREGAP